MIYFKSCPRCAGDVFFSADEEGLALSCLQCSRHWGGNRSMLFDVGAPDNFWPEVEDSGLPLDLEQDQVGDEEAWEQEVSYA